MADQFDLEQGIMGCWHITDDLNVLFEELVENQTFTKDQASNFVLGLSTIYEAKFDKLFRTFEEFLKDFYKMKKELQHTQAQLFDANEELCAMEEANELAADATLATKSLEDLFLEEEEEAMRQREEELHQMDYVEDEFGRFSFVK